MLIRLNNHEREALLKYESGPFGEDNLHSFMAEMCARMQDDGSIDIGRDDQDRMQELRLEGEPKRKRIDKVFNRPIEEAVKGFFE